jgi:2'-5' RNA ligase
MKFFVGLVPPQDIYNHLQAIQKRYGDNRLEPHITIRPPITVVDEAEWIGKIVSTAASFEPFPITLPGTGNFGKRVLYVQVVAEALQSFYHALVPQLAPFERSESNKVTGDYHPHLTLGRTWCGFTAEDFANMKHLADDYLRDRNISFMATAIRIYHKPDHHGRYQTFRDVDLGKK